MRLNIKEVNNINELKKALENNTYIPNDFQVAVIIYAFDKDNKIIDVVDGDCINDLTFEKILIYPQLCVREKMLISLAHKKLNENQLRSLCDVGIAFECYFELAILYYTEKRYKLETLKAFIQEFSKCKYSYMLDELIFELTNYYIASEEMKCEYINGIGCGL